jgi:hypothetical protein
LTLRTRLERVEEVSRAADWEPIGEFEKMLTAGDDDRLLALGHRSWLISPSTSPRTAGSAWWAVSPTRPCGRSTLPPSPRPARTIVDEATVASDLDRIDREQREDGGRSVDLQSYSPAAALEWGGYATVRALSVLPTTP